MAKKDYITNAKDIRRFTRRKKMVTNTSEHVNRKSSPMQIGGSFPNIPRKQSLDVTSNRVPGCWFWVGYDPVPGDYNWDYWDNIHDGFQNSPAWEYRTGEICGDAFWRAGGTSGGECRCYPKAAVPHSRGRH